MRRYWYLQPLFRPLVGSPEEVTRECTIIYNNARKTNLGFDFCKCLDNRIRITEVTLDIQLIGCAFFFFRSSRDKSELVAFGCEGFSDMMADIGTGS